MSNGFESENTKSFSSPIHEIESRTLAKMQGGAIVGNVQTSWGRIEIIKKHAMAYQLIIIKNRPYSVKAGPTYGDFKDALDVAHDHAKMKLSGLKQLDIFTEDYGRNSDAFEETTPGVSTRKDANPYEAPHDDFPAHVTDEKFWKIGSVKSLAAAGRAKDQAPLNEIDEEEHLFQANIKSEDEQFPGGQFVENKMDKNDQFDEEKENEKFSLSGMLNKLSSGKVDEKVWDEAKKKSEEQYGKVKWPFVNWLYDKIKKKK